MTNESRFSTCRPLAAALALGVMLTATGGCSPTISDRTVTRIETTLATQRQAQESALFIDARPAAAYQSGHIPGAINLRLGELSYTGRDPRLTGRSPLIVYGQNPGSATALALAKRMMELKYSGVEYFEPGIEGWRRAGLPVERDEP